MNGVRRHNECKCKGVDGGKGTGSLDSIPVEIDPEQAEASLQGEALVLVLPVSAAANRSA